MYEEQKSILDAMEAKAEGRGSNDFYDCLVKKIERLYDNWARIDEDGDLTSEEITKLIEKKDFILKRIKELRDNNS